MIGKTRVRPHGSGLRAEVPFQEAYDLSVMDMRGRVLYSAAAGGPRNFNLSGQTFTKGISLVAVRLHSGARYSMAVLALLGGEPYPGGRAAGTRPGRGLPEPCPGPTGFASLGFGIF